MADVLRRVPGVEVQRSGSPGKLTNVRIRGAAPGQIQVLVDGSDPNTADLVRNFVEALWVNWLEQESLGLGQPLMPSGVRLDHRLWFNPEVSSRNYLVPGSVALILTLIGALRKRGGRRGVASLCIGGGEATAMAIELL